MAFASLSVLPAQHLRMTSIICSVGGNEPVHITIIASVSAAIEIHHKHQMIHIEFTQPLYQRLCISAQEGYLNL